MSRLNEWDERMFNLLEVHLGLPGTIKNCCGNEASRGHLCEFHEGWMCGMEALIELLSKPVALKELTERLIEAASSDPHNLFDRAVWEKGSPWWAEHALTALGQWLSCESSTVEDVARARKEADNDESS